MRHSSDPCYFQRLSCLENRQRRPDCLSLSGSDCNSQAGRGGIRPGGFFACRRWTQLDFAAGWKPKNFEHERSVDPGSVPLGHHSCQPVSGKENEPSKTSYILGFLAASQSLLLCQTTNSPQSQNPHPFKTSKDAAPAAVNPLLKRSVQNDQNHTRKVSRQNQGCPLISSSF